MRSRYGRPMMTLLAVLLLAVAACGQAAGDESSGGETQGDEVSAQAAMDAFTQCMRELGVDMPDQGVGAGSGGIRIDPGDAEQATVEAAMDACREHLDEAVQGFGGAGQELDPQEQERIEEAAMAFAQCMRVEGIDWPDPDGAGGMGMQARGDLDVDFSDPAVQSALRTCQDESGLEINIRGSDQ